MKNIHKAFAIRFLGILLPLIAIAWAVYLIDKGNEKLRLLSGHIHVIDSQKTALDSHVSGLISDIKVLSQSGEILDYLDSPNEETHLRLDRRLMSFASATGGRYDQIRLLNSDGMERVRINNLQGRPSLTPGQQLQDKSDRYYFTHTLKLAHGEVFVSRFDLNMERGAVEVPWKPVIRLGTPLLNSQGEKVAILLLNVLGEQLLQSLDIPHEALQGTLMLLNDSGYWLYGEAQGHNWGFMFGDGPRFSDRHPEAWRQISQQAAGQWQGTDATYTYTTLKPPSITNGKVVDPQYSDRWWKLVIRSPRPEWSLHADERMRLFLYALPLLLLVVGFVSWEWSRIANIAAKAQTRIKELSRVVEQSDEIVYITDKGGLIHYVNPAFERVTGYRADEVIGRNPRLLKSGKMGDAFYQELWQTILAGESFQGVITNRCKDGRFYYEEKLITPIYDTQGAIIQFVSTGRDISGQSKLLKLSEQLHKLAYTDSLTGLANRASLNDHLRQAMQRANRFNELMVLLFFDLDGFKKVNDTLGHEMGDQLLINFAEQLRQGLRETDTAIRFGGDEFLSIMEGFHNVESIEQTVSKILQSFQVPQQLTEHNIQVSASIGVAIYPFDDTVDAEALIQQADCAMYHAKASGKNRFSFYEYNMQTNRNGAEDDKPTPTGQGADIELS